MRNVVGRTRCWPPQAKWPSGAPARVPSEPVPETVETDRCYRDDMRRIPVLATTVSLIAGAFLTVSGTTAHADNSYYDIWGIRGADRVINSDSCRYVTVTASTNINPDDLLSVDAEVWRGSENVGTVSLDHTSAGRLRGQYYHCPYEGVGTFRVGPSEISMWTNDYDLNSHMDYSKGSFVVKQASRIRGVKSSRKGSTVTIKANPQYYATGWDSGWTAINTDSTDKPKKKVFRLQRRNANGTGSWRTIKRAASQKGKTLTLKVKASKKAQYRVVFNETRYTFSSTSKVVRR